MKSFRPRFRFVMVTVVLTTTFLWQLTTATVQAAMFGVPTSGRVTSVYAPGTHSGVDIASAAQNVYDRDIISVGTGVVAYADWDDTELGWGDIIVVYHGQVNGQGLWTFYSHMGEDTNQVITRPTGPHDNYFAVAVGQRVHPGKLLGWQGTSARSTGNHLDFEVRVGGTNGSYNGRFAYTHVDPSNYIAEDFNLNDQVTLSPRMSYSWWDWTAAASPNGLDPDINSHPDHDHIILAMDRDPNTRWTTEQAQVSSDALIDINLGAVQSVYGLRLDSAGSPNDLAPYYNILVTSNPLCVNWTQIASYTNYNVAAGVRDVFWSPVNAHCVRIDQIPGGSSVWWFSIHELYFYSTTERAAASHNNVQEGVDNVRQSLDNNLNTRWSSTTPQINIPDPHLYGQWYRFDLGRPRPINRVRLDNAGSSNDYPRSYWVQVSRDEINWSTVNIGSGLNPLDVTFEPFVTRFVRVLQKGASAYWWSVHEADAYTSSAIYLPDVRNSAGWASSIVVRNNHASYSARVEVTYFNAGGGIVNTDSHYTSPQSTYTFTPPSGFSGSAVVVASQDVAVIVRSKRGDEVTIYNGLKASGGSPGWERVGSTLYAPIVKNNRYGRSSTIEVLNTGSASASVTVTYYRYDSGAARGSSTQTLASNARGSFNAADKCYSNEYCAAIITGGGQPLAAVVREYASSDGSAPTTHNTFAAAAAANYVPLYKNARYGQTSGIAVMNTGGSTAYVTLTYYDANSAATYAASDSVPPKAVKTFVGGAGGVPAGFIGAAVVTSNQPVVSALHESGGSFYKATDSFLSGAGALYAAELNTSSGYASGLAVQNAGGSSATVQVYYYHSNGSSAGTRGPYTLPVGETLILNDSNGGVPASFYGSARIVSTNGVPLVVAVNYAAPGSGDTQATYNTSQP